MNSPDLWKLKSITTGQTITGNASAATAITERKLKFHFVSPYCFVAA